ncbi:protein PLASTID MOVEMENT IMPAIRED 2-like isoform X1 [Musa acuminata AAA Group]|uniref:protein PLASTID MOVEMENT IMPAIRED 2-like isoform X1 n=1 Tax=Musa acuminata AAA Group TaxID=214697 RepID=UPI0031DCBDDB
MERNRAPLPEISTFFCLKDLSSQCKELIFAEMKVNKLINRKKVSEREKVQLLSELCVADDEAKDLTIRIEEAHAKAITYKLKLQSLKNSDTSEDEQLMILPPKSSRQYTEILREVDDVKQQICGLKLDIASALQEKARARSEIESSSAEARSYSRYKEELRREIDEVNVEQEFIDLARIEADGEFRRLEAQREAEAAHFTESVRKANSRIDGLRREITSAKQLQATLMITSLDVDALQNEMEFIRAAEKSYQKTYLVEDTGRMEGEQETDISLLRSTKAELEAAKNELSTVKEEGYKLMDEMDGIRKELIRIADGKEQSSRAKKNSDSCFETLNTKLHKAMSKMESASMAEKRADTIVANLSAALQQLHSDIDAAKREAELVSEETKAVRTETEKTRMHTQSLKERLQEAMEELNTVKAAEANALEGLKAITESTMRERAISSIWSSTITISKFEYYYLTKQAKAAQEVADKKVAAAQAWMEALKAKTEERRMNAETDPTQSWVLVPVERESLSKPKKGSVLKKAIKKEINHHEEEREQKLVQSHDMKLAIAMPRRSLTVSGVSGTSRRLHASRKSNSTKQRPSSAFTPPSSAHKKGKLVNTLVRFLTTPKQRWGSRRNV